MPAARPLGSLCTRPDGYLRIKTNEGWVYAHRQAMELKLGRSLHPWEHVHHIDGNPGNNAPDNLRLCLGDRGHKYHHRGVDSNRRLPTEPNILVQCLCGCGGSLKRYDRQGRPRYYLRGHNAYRESATGRFYSYEPARLGDPTIAR